ncbi:hypothetical protein GCM10010218_64450 [Streptomyces mashuensis]|uniref:N-acetylmuramoyl-L-alanine amidase n=1 Tax=Streptomyces mashuensis TaxID=33904 RepID=A0A919B940_9ACTN|nr:peptidoglycan recognition protein [Streptomyces mashuensis]GHF74486.1 hypothetical protein GCM10010218_64450 [Streptomyces mashuensis]
MRGNFVSSAAVTACAAVLTLPFLATPAGATPSGDARPGTTPAGTPRPGTSAPPGARGTTSAKGAPEGASSALRRAARPRAALRAAGAARRQSLALPGATRSLPLVPLGPTRRTTGRTPAPARGVPAREVKPFSLVGIVWDDAARELRGTAQVRTRALSTGTWSDWQDIETHGDRPDPGTPEARGKGVRGATAPLWVGPSDAVEVRVRPDTGAGAPRETRALPPGMRLELVDPGKDPARPAARPRPRSGGSAPQAPLATDDDHAASAANAPLAPVGALEIPAASKAESARDVAATHVDVHAAGEKTPADGREEGGDPEDQALPGTTDPGDGTDTGASPTGRWVGPRPRIVTRAGWGADETIREHGFPYDKTVRAAFVHHTASGNTYSCSQSPSVIRGIYRYHVVSSGWRDLGYNFLVDKCGTVYEGRAGGVAKPVRGAHTLGFNTNSMGIAVLGTFARTGPSGAAVEAVAAITAWKLGLYDVNPRGTVTLVSGGGNLFKKGSTVKLKVISGHRDGYATECPGDRLYARLGTIRSAAARLQGR